MKLNDASYNKVSKLAPQITLTALILILSGLCYLWMNAYLVLLPAVAHEVVRVHQVRLSQVDVPVKDQAVSKI